MRKIESPVHLKMPPQVAKDIISHQSLNQEQIAPFRPDQQQTAPYKASYLKSQIMPIGPHSFETSFYGPQILKEAQSTLNSNYDELSPQSLKKYSIINNNEANKCNFDIKTCQILSSPNVALDIKSFIPLNVYQFQKGEQQTGEDFMPKRVPRYLANLTARK